jgi:hypothetical protein
MLGQFLQAADSHEVSALEAVTVPGVEMVAADEESVGSSTMSRAVDAAATPVGLALAIRSGSGVCPAPHGERFGSGEPCTGTSALHGSSHYVPADSPWQLVLDMTRSSDPRTAAAAQAKVAQSALRNALLAAKAYFTVDGTFDSVSPDKLHELDPYLTFVDGNTPVAATATVSVAIVGNRFAAAALAGNGICYWITENFVSPQYGRAHRAPARAPWRSVESRLKIGGWRRCAAACRCTAVEAFRLVVDSGRFRERSTA